MRRLLTALILACLLVPAAAQADGGTDKLIRDACFDEHIDGTYTQAQYKKALENISSDADEYTGCREVLERGRLAALNKKHDQAPSGNATNGGGGGTTNGGGGAGTTNGGSGSSTGNSGSAPASGSQPAAKPTAEQQKSIAKASETAKPVEVGGKLVQPGELGMGALSGSGHSVPTSLAALIALLTASALGGGCWWLWSRVLARRFG